MSLEVETCQSVCVRRADRLMGTNVCQSSVCPLKLSRDSQTKEQPYRGVVICGVFLGLMVGVVGG